MSSHGYVFWMQPEVFNMACVFFPLLVWQVLRRRDELRGRDLFLLAVGGALSCGIVVVTAM